MDRPPRRPTESVVTFPAAVRLASDAGILAAGSLAAYAWSSARYGRGPAAGTSAFLALTGGQLLHAYNVRRRDGSTAPNGHLDAAVGVSMVLQAGALMIPALRRLLGVTPLRLLDVASVAAGMLAPFLLNRRHQPRLSSATSA
jgi:Ca2+-transporting ATPase